MEFLGIYSQTEWERGRGESLARYLFIYFILFIYLFSHSQNLIQREQKFLLKL